ncbi:MAG: hypothetical protein LLG00_16855 [Planctomycetaceae bacterium]|nr:hypothetical protein [Planctomycetaceae bacterium]
MAAVQHNAVLLYDIVNSELLRSKVFLTGKMTMHDDADGALGVTFDPKGVQLAVSCGRGAVYLWDPFRDSTPLLLKKCKRSVECVQYSRDGTLMAFGSRDGVFLWDVRQRKTSLSLDATGVHCVGFSPDGKMLASGGEGGQLWDLAIGKRVARFRAPIETVVSVAFSPDGTRLLSGDQNGSICIWDTKTETVAGILKCADTVTGIYVLADNRTAISADWHGTICAWDLLSKRKIGAISHRHRTVQSMAVSPDERTIVCGESYGTLRVIEVSAVLGSRAGNGKVEAGK